MKTDEYLLVIFGWLLGLLTAAIPKIYKLINKKIIVRRYSPLISQINEGKLTRTSNIKMPSFLAGKRQSYSALPKEDKELLFNRLPEIVRTDGDWKEFDRIVKILDLKMQQ